MPSSGLQDVWMRGKVRCRPGCIKDHPGGGVKMAEE